MKKVQKKNFLKFILLILICGLLTVDYGLIYAAVPHLINYQGRLIDSGGGPLNGSYVVTFRIYDAETAGTLLWEEIQNSVVVQKGIFNVLLGSVTAMNLTFDKPYFLEIKVGQEVLTPRQRISSGGYAIRAETAEQAANSLTVGNVGVSATPQANKLLPLDANAKLSSVVLKAYNSNWFIAGLNGVYTVTHNLGTKNLLISIYGSQSSDGSNAWILSSFNDCKSDNNDIIQGPFIRISDNNTVVVYTGNETVYTEVNRGEQVPRTSGYLRLVILALE